MLLFASPLWSNQFGGGAEGWVNINAPGYNSDIWHTYSDGVATIVDPQTGSTGFSDGTFCLTATFPYYYVEFALASYDLGYYYWWFYGGKPSNEFSAAVDNLSLRFTLPDIPGDFNQDGLINALDIHPFILALTDPPAYQSQYPWAHRPSLDPNADGLINALDIQPFIQRLTAPPVPEPANPFLLLPLLARLPARLRN